MTEKHREFLQANLYVVAGFVAGLAVGIGICTTSIGRTFLDPTQFPQDVRGMILMTLVLLGSIIIGYLRRVRFASERSDKLSRQADLSQSNT